MLHIGIIREEKAKPDSRVPLTPEQCEDLIKNKGITISVQSSPIRCFSDEEYIARGVPVVSDVSDCNILLGVKEVPIDRLIPQKTYFFFSHTIKEQAYNRDLLISILEKEIRLIDYEVLTDANNHRLIAFGRHAGMVGAHNAIYTYAQRTGEFEIPRMKDFDDYQAAQDFYLDMKLPAIKIVLTGHGRVGNGAAAVLNDMKIKQVSPEEFLTKTYNYPVYTQLRTEDYIQHMDSEREFVRAEFYEDPSPYVSNFKPYLAAADIFINGIYWDNRAPSFFNLNDIQKPDFNIQVIADVTCDIAPKSSIPTTIKASSIDDPIFGFSKSLLEETEAHTEDSIDIMSIDNLPNELPKDASRHFGNQFILHILPELHSIEESDIIQRATVTQGGKLGHFFTYLENFVEGKVYN